MLESRRRLSPACPSVSVVCLLASRSSGRHNSINFQAVGADREPVVRLRRRGVTSSFHINEFASIVGPRRVASQPQVAVWSVIGAVRPSVWLLGYDSASATQRSFQHFTTAAASDALSDHGQHPQGCPLWLSNQR